MGKDNLGEINYTPFASRYADRIRSKPHNAYYERPATLSLLPDVKDLKVLDAGCGSGINTVWLLEHGASVIAVDATPDFVKMTEEQVGGKGEVLQWDIQEPLSFANDATFDLVLCSLVLDYIKDWLPVFQEFQRLLKSGGALVFSCGNPASDFYHEWPQDDYFEVTLHEKEWEGFGKPYPLIRSYRRPLQAVLNPLIQAGFLLDRVLEPQPSQDFPVNAANKEIYEDLMRHPCFLHIRARKRAIQQ
jgi:SAM-dependent methyltransferase